MWHFRLLCIALVALQKIALPPPHPIPSTQALNRMSAMQVDDALFQVAFDRYEKQGASRRVLESMPQVLRTFFTTRDMDQQVAYGSFNLYLCGGSPDRENISDLALSDLKLIGDTTRVELLQRAKQISAVEMSRLPSGGGYMVRNKIYVSWNSKYRYLETQYRKVTPTLTELRARYAKTHLGAIEKALKQE